MKNGKAVYMEVFKKVFPNIEDGDYEKMEVGNPMEWDSLHHMQLINGLEIAFSIRLGIDAIINFKSFHQGIGLLQEKYHIDMT